MSTYTVHARPWRRGWELHIEGIGVTQSRSLRDAGRMARDYIKLDTGTDPGPSGVEIIPELGDLEHEVGQARESVVQANRVQRAAAQRSRKVARKLKSAGLTGRDIAVVMHLSPQRVSQLLAAQKMRRIASEARQHVPHG